MHNVMNVMMEVVMKMVVVLKMMELMVDCIATLVRDGNVDGTLTFGGDIEKAAKKDIQRKQQKKIYSERCEKEQRLMTFASSDVSNF